MLARRRSAVLECLEQIRQREPTVNLSHVLTYLYVCENEGINVSELAIVLRTTRPTASRNVRALLAREVWESSPPFLGLLRLAPNPRDARGKTLWLSEDGLSLRDHLNGAIRAAEPLVSLPERSWRPEIATSRP